MQVTSSKSTILFINAEDIDWLSRWRFWKIERRRIFEQDKIKVGEELKQMSFEEGKNAIQMLTYYSFRNN